MSHAWSPLASQLIETRPSFWETRLFSQCLIELIEQQLSASSNEPITSELTASKFTCHVASLQDGQQFMKRVIQDLEDFLERLAAAIKISPDDNIACFGPPGQPGDPRCIAELAQRLARNFETCQQKATEIQCLRVVCATEQLQVVADLFLRSLKQYTGREYKRFEEFVRALGPEINRDLDTGNANISLNYTASISRPTFAPLFYELGKKLKPARKLPTLMTIDRVAIQVTFIDTETTGLGEDDEPISIGAVKYEVAPDSGILTRVLDTYYELREPIKPVGDQAFKVHGISNDQLRGKRWDLNRVQSLLDVHLVIAHNADFDMRMLSKVVTIDARRWTCSMKGIMNVWERSSWISLDNLADRFDLDRPSPHNALSDAQTLTQVLAQPLPTSLVEKTVLWELIRRHFGFQAMDVGYDDYLVWGHYSRDGTLHYVWTARPGEPNGFDDSFLSYYVAKHLPQGCVAVPIKGDLTLDQAMETKDQLLNEHHATLLNVRNAHRPVNRHALAFRTDLYATLARGRDLERSNDDAAILCYASAISSVLESGYLQVESGLIGQIQLEMDKANRQLEHLLIAPLDRVSLLLCRQGAPHRAMALLNGVKAKFPTLVELPKAIPIVKRIYKALSKFPPSR